MLPLNVLYKEMKKGRASKKLQKTLYRSKIECSWQTIGGLNEYIVHWPAARKWLDTFMGFNVGGNLAKYCMENSPLVNSDRLKRFYAVV